MSAQRAIRTETETPDQSVHWLALAGLVGVVLFEILLFVAGAMRTGYSLVSQPASDLGVGQGGSLFGRCVMPGWAEPARAQGGRVVASSR